MRQLLADEAIVLKTEDKEGERYRAHTNNEKTTIVKEIAFNTCYEECMRMSQSRDDDSTKVIFDTGATSGVATEKIKEDIDTDRRKVQDNVQHAHGRYSSIYIQYEYGSQYEIYSYID